MQQLNNISKKPIRKKANFWKNFWRRFRFKNIWQEPVSTLIGIWILYTTFELLKEKIITILEASPVILLVIGFLLYGRRGKEVPK